MDFTREPIIQTIITPKEGCKLVVRSSKNAGQEEYFVDAVEVVSFGHASFFRSLERPKPFLVPIADYEVLEVREARMVLKSVGIDRSIKIGGGRESVSRAIKGADKEVPVPVEIAKPEGLAPVNAEGALEVKTEVRPGLEKKKDRRRQYRKRRGGQAADKEEEVISAEASVGQSDEEKTLYPVIEEQFESGQSSGNLFSALLQPPPTLISETINRYRENALFKSAFFLTEEEQYKPHDKVQELLNEDEDEEYTPSLQEPVFTGPDGLPERSFDALKALNLVQPPIFYEAPEVSYQQHPVEEFVEPIKPLEDISSGETLEPIDSLEPTESLEPVESFGPVESVEPIYQPAIEHREMILEEKTLDEPSSLSIFQEEDDEKFNEEKKD